MRLDLLPSKYVNMTGHASPCYHLLPCVVCVCEQGNGLGGPIAAVALCGLTALRVLALSQNMLSGELPACLATMQVVWLWADGNRIQ